MCLPHGFGGRTQRGFPRQEHRFGAIAALTALFVCALIAAVKAGRKVTPFRRLKIHPPRESNGAPAATKPVGQAGGEAIQGAGGGAPVPVCQGVAVPFSVRRKDLGVVDEPVDHRGGDDLVAEDLAPGREGLVGGDDHRGALVAAPRRA